MTTSIQFVTASDTFFPPLDSFYRVATVYLIVQDGVGFLVNYDVTAVGNFSRLGPGQLNKKNQRELVKVVEEALASGKVSGRIRWCSQEQSRSDWSWKVDTRCGDHFPTDEFYADLKPELFCNGDFRDLTEATKAMFWQAAFRTPPSGSVV